jgi:hypothetical protein
MNDTALPTVSFATIRTGQVMVASRLVERQNRRVLEMIFVLVRALALACHGHREPVLENLALRGGARREPQQNRDGAEVRAGDPLGARRHARTYRPNDYAGGGPAGVCRTCDWNHRGIDWGMVSALALVRCQPAGSDHLDGGRAIRRRGVACGLLRSGPTSRAR